MLRQACAGKTGCAEQHLASAAMANNMNRVNTVAPIKQPGDLVKAVTGTVDKVNLRAFRNGCDQRVQIFQRIVNKDQFDRRVSISSGQVFALVFRCDRINGGFRAITIDNGGGGFRSQITIKQQAGFQSKDKRCFAIACLRSGFTHDDYSQRPGVKNEQPSRFIPKWPLNANKLLISFSMLPKQ